MRHLLAGLLLTVSLYGQTAPEYGVGFWRGRTVAYQVVNGWAIAQGDIILGRVEELQDTGETTRNLRPLGSGRSQSQFRWTDRALPYVIDAAVPNQKRVTDAIQHWNDKTPMRLVARAEERNYVRFIQDNTNPGVCSSSLGMVGGEQMIRVADTCDAGSLIHEIGHAVGLYHEQERTDRDRYVSINWDNIDPRFASNFTQSINNALDYGMYDYCSIMHYSVSGFETRLQAYSMETIPAGIPIGQRAGLSPGDLDAVNRMYGVAVTSTTISSCPAGLEVIVDGERVATPKSFDWAPGSTHTLDVPVPQGSGNARYLFAGWNDGGSQSHEVTASPEITVLAAAFIRQFRVPKDASPVGAGTITIDPPSEDGFYTDGAPIKVEAVPASGFSFYSWSSVPSGVHGLSENPANVRVTGTVNYTALFSRTPTLVTIDSNPRHRTIAGDGSNHGAVWGANWAAASTHTISAPSPQLGPSSVTRYVFKDWSDGGAASHSITVPQSPATYTASFRTENLLTVVVDGNGTVERSPAATDNFYESGTAVQLTARPGAGFQFVNWTGDLTGNAADRNLTMNGQRYMIAVFRGANSTPFYGIVNAATQQQIGYVAPGELLVVNGTHAVPPDTDLRAQPNADGTLPTVLGDTRVMIDGKFAPVLAVKGTQVTTMVPYSSAGKTQVPVQIVYQGRGNTFSNVELLKAVPGIFSVDGSGSGPAAVMNQDGSANSDSNPAARQSTITFQATGAGQTDPPGSDSAVVGDSLPVPVLPIAVSVGGVEAPVVSATGVKGSLGGMLQVTVQVPDGAPSGAVPLVLKVGSVSARQRVTVAIQ